MSLYPGAPAYDALTDKYEWSDTELELADSMAKEIEDALQDIYSKINNGKIIGDVGKEDRNLLFVAISRGILNYLKNHKKDIEHFENVKIDMEIPRPP